MQLLKKAVAKSDFKGKWTESNGIYVFTAAGRSKLKCRRRDGRLEFFGEEGDDLRTIVALNTESIVEGTKKAIREAVRARKEEKRRSLEEYAQIMERQGGLFSRPSRAGG